MHGRLHCSASHHWSDVKLGWGQCFFSNSTVHGCRALWQGPWNSWTWKNRKGSRLKNAIIWHEGKLYLTKLFTYNSNYLHLHLVIELSKHGFFPPSLDNRLWSNHSSWGDSQLGGGADVPGAVVATVSLHHCPHSSDALYCRLVSKLSSLHSHRSFYWKCEPQLFFLPKVFLMMNRLLNARKE